MIKESHQFHQEVMKSVLNELQDTPLVLKGGTALLFCYDLDRHSEDLDFDSNIKLNLNSKITKAFNKQKDIRLENLRTVKNTSTTSRYRLAYKSPHGLGHLKIEIKNNVQTINSKIVNGIKTYPINDIFAMKLSVADIKIGRAQVRDLYDISHIIKTHKDKLLPEQINAAKSFSKDLQQNLQLFSGSHQEDNILKNIPLKTMVDNIENALRPTAKQRLAIIKTQEANNRGKGR